MKPFSLNIIDTLLSYHLDYIICILWKYISLLYLCCCRSVTKSRPTLWGPMDCCTYSDPTPCQVTLLTHIPTFCNIYYLIQIFHIISWFSHCDWIVDLKLNIQKMKIMASDPITTWKTDGETMETVTVLIFLGSKIIADGDCNHEIKRHLLLGREVMTNQVSILKSRDITLPAKVHIVKAMVFQ